MNMPYIILLSSISCNKQIKRTLKFLSITVYLLQQSNIHHVKTSCGHTKSILCSDLDASHDYETSPSQHINLIIQTFLIIFYFVMKFFKKHYAMMPYFEYACTTAFISDLHNFLLSAQSILQIFFKYSLVYFSCEV